MLFEITMKLPTMNFIRSNLFISFRDGGVGSTRAMNPVKISEMFNIRGILSRRSDQNRSPESLLSKSSDDSTDNVDSAEGFLCPFCFAAFPAADALQNHYETAHNEDINGASSDGRNKYVCPACKMKLGSEIELQAHYSRHHSHEKTENDSKARELQMKAWEDIKQYLENELKTKVQEIEKLKQERDGFEQMAAKLTSELADLKLNVDELNSEKICLETALKAFEEKISKLEIEIQQRPEMDDVIELKKGINTAQEKMNELALQKEAEKDLLQKQYNILQETCSKLKAEKEQLESFIRTCPKKEEIESLQKKISEMSLSMSSLKQNLDLKERENQKLQIALEKERFQQQFLNEQALHLKAAAENEAKLNEMRSSLKRVQIDLRDSNEKCAELENDLSQIEGKLKETNAEKDALSKDLNLQIANLSAAHGADQARLQNLEKEFTNLTKLYDEKSSSLENSLKEWKMLQHIQGSVGLTPASEQVDVPHLRPGEEGIVSVQFTTPAVPEYDPEEEGSVVSLSSSDSDAEFVVIPMPNCLLPNCQISQYLQSENVGDMKDSKPSSQKLIKPHNINLKHAYCAETVSQETGVPELSETPGGVEKEAEQKIFISHNASADGSSSEISIIESGESSPTSENAMPEISSIHIAVTSDTDRTVVKVSAPNEVANDVQQEEPEVEEQSADIPGSSATFPKFPVEGITSIYEPATSNSEERPVQVLPESIVTVPLNVASTVYNATKQAMTSYLRRQFNEGHIVEGATGSTSNPMDQLVEMGFCNRQQNEELLKKHKNDVALVVGALVNLSDNEWYASRHVPPTTPTFD